MRPRNHACSSASSASPRSAMSSCVRASSRQRRFCASSPPNPITSESNTSHTSSRTSQTNRTVSSSTFSTSSEMPNLVHGSRTRARTASTPPTPYSGWAARMALACPGTSISGTTRMPRSPAYRTSSRSSACV